MLRTIATGLLALILAVLGNIVAGWIKEPTSRLARASIVVAAFAIAIAVSQLQEHKSDGSIATPQQTSALTTSPISDTNAGVVASAESDTTAAIEPISLATALGAQEPQAAVSGVLHPSSSVFRLGGKGCSNGAISASVDVPTGYTHLRMSLGLDDSSAFTGATVQTTISFGDRQLPGTVRLNEPQVIDMVGDADRLVVSLETLTSLSEPCLPEPVVVVMFDASLTR